MKILVLGGTGAMGVDLVKILAKRGDNVTVTSRSERKSEFDNVKYVKGDAHDTAFLKSVLYPKYDVIIDFMAYTTNEFKERYEFLLNSTTQYVFLSSSRVYADSSTPITEDSPRLLDVCKDKEFLMTDEYALQKAREENLLRSSGESNWTIIRPYITYNNERLQLGIFEKEIWLHRALRGQTIIFPKDIASHITTLTWGRDVAQGIAALVGNTNAYGKAVHIATQETIYWGEVLELYMRVFREVTGKQMKVKLTASSDKMADAIKRQYPLKYDRLLDRKFDNSLFRKLSQDNGINIDFVSPQVGLEHCLKEFLTNPVFRDTPLRTQAWMDKEMSEKLSLSELKESQKKLRYLIYRYVPFAFLDVFSALINQKKFYIIT